MRTTNNNCLIILKLHHHYKLMFIILSEKLQITPGGKNGPGRVKFLLNEGD